MSWVSRSVEHKRCMHTVLDIKSGASLAEGVIAKTSITFSVMGKSSSPQVRLSPQELSPALYAAMHKYITSLPNADAHMRALAQLRVSSKLRETPSKNQLEYEVHVHGRQATLDLVAQHAYTPAQVGGFSVTVGGRTLPLMIHRFANSSYVHSYELVKFTCKDEVDPHKLCKLVLADSIRHWPHAANRPLPVSPFVDVKWVGVVDKAADGYQLKWTEGPHASSVATPLPAWVSRQVREGDLLALAGAYTADVWMIHYKPEPHPVSCTSANSDEN